MKVLILGITGMLGSTLFKNLSYSSEITTFGTMRDNHDSLHFKKNYPDRIIKGINAENFDSIEYVFNKILPDVVVNCIGAIKQIPEGNNPIVAIHINSLVPHFLSNLCKNKNIRLIHFSTDCVFSGEKGNYKERDIPDASDVYGRSKMLGEVVDNHVLTLRTSIIGHELDGNKSLLSWFLSQKGSVRGFKKAIFSGLTAVEIAELIKKIIFEKSNLSGLYHVAGNAISKYDLLCIIKKIYKKSIYVLPSDDFVIDRSLNASLFNQEMNYKPPDWPELIYKMKAFQNRNEISFMEKNKRCLSVLESAY